MSDQGPLVKSEKRSKNFKEFEVQLGLLLDLVNKSKNILENKHTDQVTVKEKEKCWGQIEKDFNLASGVYFRDWKTLKNKYENIKKTSKKKWAEERKYVLGTGGGPSKPTMLTSTDVKIKEIIGDLPLIGMPSQFDCDTVDEVGLSDSKSGCTATEAGLIFDLEETPVVLEEEVTDDFFDHCYNRKAFVHEEMQKCEDDGVPKDTSSGQFLIQKSPRKKSPTPVEVKKMPKSPIFDTQFSVKKLQNKTSSPLKLKKKRSNPLDHTLAGRKIEVLAETKKDLCELHKELVQRQIQHEEEEHKKKMQLLELKIKNQELKLKKTKAELDFIKPGLI